MGAVCAREEKLDTLIMRSYSRDPTKAMASRDEVVRRVGGEFATILCGGVCSFTDMRAGSGRVAFTVDFSCADMYMQATKTHVRVHVHGVVDGVLTMSGMFGNFADTWTCRIRKHPTSGEMRAVLKVGSWKHKVEYSILQ